MIFPLSSRSTRAVCGAMVVGRAEVMERVAAVEVEGIFFSVPPVAALRREARPRRV
jgi:hypothetical protein